MTKNKTLEKLDEARKLISEAGQSVNVLEEDVVKLVISKPTHHHA
jgi:hypothetical protein